MSQNKNYLKFLYNSVNAHGVHSPFVYYLVTKGFYNKEVSAVSDYSEHLSKQAATTLLKTITYFKSYKLLVLGSNAADVTETVRLNAQKINAKVWFYSPNVPVPGGADLAILSDENPALLPQLLERLLADTNNNTVCVISNIHKSQFMEEAWRTLQEHPAVTVSIDTYHLGLLFFRKEQAKQHFIIRPYTSVLIDAILGVRTLWGLLG